MKANPEGDEFVYLKQAWPDALPLNVFDLQVTLAWMAAVCIC